VDGVLSKLGDEGAVNLVAIFGAARGGKSFLMNQLAGQDDIFKISNDKARFAGVLYCCSTVKQVRHCSGGMGSEAIVHADTSLRASWRPVSLSYRLGPGICAASFGLSRAVLERIERMSGVATPRRRWVSSWCRWTATPAQRKRWQRSAEWLLPLL